MSSWWWPTWKIRFECTDNAGEDHNAVITVKAARLEKAIEYAYRALEKKTPAPYGRRWLATYGRKVKS